ncbi:hypothetical protein I601_2343 [Nocardioides dokdonensis FR1436]|uniref:Histone deacetylase n=1 Tax=Nocardioides dokdonensis FR1436 TaxID=1300347 RepID=A0A1A9GMT3_9ACTN|nr:hypothetical protein [Nocardioides dokdonensis]ANH38765.1 hypothetical protein I601_2343 [Nocardioides dokdonensis FR1436]
MAKPTAAPQAARPARVALDRSTRVPDRVAPGRIWYAAYGSNLCRDRFLTYLHGGTPPGSARTYSGSDDTSVPDGDVAFALPGSRVHFALTSAVWGGGVAFLDTDVTAPGAYAWLRAYRISTDQLAQVVAQENGRHASAAAPVPVAEAVRDGRAGMGQGAYETLVHLGDLDGLPVVTFTAPFSLAQARVTAPTAAYLRTIGAGLAETAGHPPDRQAAYLSGCPGADRWSRAQLDAALAPDTS